MNKFETVFLIKDNITEEQRMAVINKIEKYIADNGKIEQTEDLGIRNLAYEIKKHKQAYYYIINFESEPSAISGLERLYRITDEVLKFITVKKDN